jgi:dethiobiotin synthetase
MIKLFITATDTDAGKTYVAQVLTFALVNKNYQVAVFKPISAGCELVSDVNGNEELINEDAKLLMQQGNCSQSITEINPIAFQPAIAPHIAAKLVNKDIDLKEINQAYEKIIAKQSDIIITEGAGGWRLPLGKGVFLSEFVQQSQQKVILVVNMKLGCLNHAVLTYEAIIADGLECIGWVANCVEPMPYLTENIAELKTIITAPLIAQFSFESNLKKVAKTVNLAPITTQN